MTKEQTISRLWENAGHGTRCEDIAAAYEAGEEAMKARLEASEVRQFLIACTDDSMSHNNRQALAAEILDELYGS